jgi:hypothetical protein
MRAKTLLLTAAISAAGIATSMAQVFSVNAVGYVNTIVPGGGFSMISNPLKAADNTINALFAGVPNGFQIYVFSAGAFKTLTFDDLEGDFGPDGDTTSLMPGQGVFVKAPAGGNVTITFVGEVPQGTLTTPLTPGFQIVSSQVPQAGTATQLGLTGAPGDQVYQYNATTKEYLVSTFDDIDNKFMNANGEATFAVGEAFWIKKAAAGTWTREFSVNTPTP